MRFQVPQNLDVSDTIFFGLGFKQILYLGGGLGFMLFLFFFGGGLLSSIIFGGPILFFAVLLSFFSFNNQPFIVLFYSALRFFSGKKMYVWKKKESEKYIQRKVQRNDDFSSPQLGDDANEHIRNLEASLIFDDTEPDDSNLEMNI